MATVSGSELSFHTLIKYFAKVLVCGGRDYTNFDRVYSHLSTLQEKAGFTILVHGGARGADSLAAKWAGGRVVEVRAYPALWDVHGRSAGPIRNREMIKEDPDIIIAYPGGKGTEDMKKVARANGVPVFLGGDD